MSQSSHSKTTTTTRPASSTTAKRQNSTTCSSLKQQQQKASTRRSESNTTKKRSTSKRPIRPPPPFSMIVLDPTVRQPGPLGNPPSLMDSTDSPITHKDDDKKEPLASSSSAQPQSPMPSAAANTSPSPPPSTTPCNHYPLTPSSRRNRSVVDHHSLNTPVVMSLSESSSSPRKNHDKPGHPQCWLPSPPLEPTCHNSKMAGCASPSPKSLSKQSHSSNIPSSQQQPPTNSQRRADGSSSQSSTSNSCMSTPRGRRHSTRTRAPAAASGAAPPPPPPFASSLSPRRSSNDHDPQKVTKPKNRWSHDTWIQTNDDHDDDKYPDMSSLSFLSTPTHTTGYYNPYDDSKECNIYKNPDGSLRNDAATAGAPLEPCRRRFSSSFGPTLPPTSPTVQHQQRRRLSSYERRPSLLDRVGTLMCLAHALPATTASQPSH